MRDRDLISAWKARRISTARLLQRVRRWFVGDDRICKPLNVESVQQAVAEALDAARSHPDQISSSASLKRFVEDFIMSGAVHLSVSDPRYGSVITSMIDEADEEVVTAVPASSPFHLLSAQPGQPLEVIGDLRKLCDLADDLTEEQVAFARLLALRVFGGWSLQKIADSRRESLVVVNDRWLRARAWLRDEPERAPGTLLTIGEIEPAILAAVHQHPRLLQSLSWRQFERLLATILERFGYQIELQRGTKDGGIDVVAIRGDSAFGPERYLLQAKRWANRVGVEPIRELLFLKQQLGASKACLATTSAFTRGAWALAEEYRWELELRDFTRLREWISRAVGK